MVKGFVYIVFSTSGAFALQELPVGGINIRVIVDVCSEIFALSQANGMCPCY